MYSNKLVCEILDYIDININTKFTIESLEYKFFYNRYYMMKLFKKEIGITIFDYVNKIRIYNSINSINRENKKMLKIAINNGFYSLEYFSEIFKREIGVSPKKYQNLVFNRNINYQIMNKYFNLEELVKYTKKYREKLPREILPVKKLSIFK